MNTLAKGCAILAFAGLAAGQARAQVKTVEVTTTQTHTIDEADAADQGREEAEAEAPPPASAPAPVQIAQIAPIEAPSVRAEALRAQIEHEGPSVAIAQRVMNAAGLFDGYMHQAVAITPAFKDGAGVRKAVMTGSAYEVQQLQEGAIAYVALAALQAPGFVQNLSDAGQDPAVRAELVHNLLVQPESVLRLPGAQDAGALAVSVVGRLGGDLLTAGAAMKQAAYDVQHQAWSKAQTPEIQAELTEVKAHAVRVSLTPDDTAGLIRNLVAARKAGADPESRAAAPTPVVARGLALAALAVLGAAGEDQAEQLTPLLTEATSAQCLKMAKLNLYQCLSVAGPQYEGMFCLGRHAMMETGQCVVAASGWSALAVNSVPVAAPVNLARSALVPIALASAGGPERDSVMDGRAAVGPSPQVEAEASPEPRPMHMAVAAQLPPRPLMATSPWRPNGPLPQDQFVGGPYGAQTAPQDDGYDQAQGPPQGYPRQGYATQGYGRYPDASQGQYADARPN
jgi:hypothetical protein